MGYVVFGIWSLVLLVRYRRRLTAAQRADHALRERFDDLLRVEHATDAGAGHEHFGAAHRMATGNERKRQRRYWISPSPFAVQSVRSECLISGATVTAHEAECV